MGLSRIGVRIPLELVERLPHKFHCRSLARAVVDGLEKERRQGESRQGRVQTNRLREANIELGKSATSMNNLARLVNTHGHLKGDPNEIYKATGRSLAPILEVLRKIPLDPLGRRRSQLSGTITLNLERKTISAITERARLEKDYVSRIICTLIRCGLDEGVTHKRSLSLIKALSDSLALIRNIRGSITCLERANVIEDSEITILSHQVAIGAALLRVSR